MDASDNMLALLESLMPEPAEDVARKIADDFRQRRVEKGMTRSDIAKKSGVSLANIARFEQKALISLNNLIELAIALGYNLEIKNIFATPKYSTMEELLQIRKNHDRTPLWLRARLQRTYRAQEIQMTNASAPAPTLATQLISALSALQAPDTKTECNASSSNFSLPVFP